ncbi:AAA family ATPase [Butyrivibrio fibrisolvens]|uniref:AAA family ATPase n=1 Tax=Butyrivibrio fibrisolvens TaxID=831 RepID=UPI0003B3C2FC|nr:AAA family ATPase [Butyrivibrio fibrisolvens]
MKTYIEVENFGKINSAKIECSGYTVFVGDNNSGKSYLMQLIYAIHKNLKFDSSDSPFVQMIDMKLKDGSSFTLGREDIRQWTQSINAQLERSKDTFVSKIFRKKVNIDRLKIDLEIQEDEEIKIQIFYHSGSIRNGKLVVGDDNSKLVSIIMPDKEEYEFEYSQDLTALLISNLITRSIFGLSGTMYLPAARAGIQLLYKDFFASKADKLYYPSDESSSSNDIGLTEPIYDYLKFLQTMTKNIDALPVTNDLIAFVDDKLIEGHINISDNNEVTYSQNNGAKNIPLYLSSSMISEMAPIIECIMDNTPHQNLVIDEVESSLHPKKQRELARLFNRMRNAGYNLIISTHSDTMAAYINNLLIASKKKLSTKKLNELNLTKMDMLKDAYITFYEFVNNNDGSSNVNELPVHEYPQEGVEFSLFNTNLNMLYEETTNILGAKNGD